MPSSLERPVIALIGNPQSGKTPDIQQTDLIIDPVFNGYVRAFDNALGWKFTESLNYDRQIASVTFSVAAHHAFLERLRNRLPNKWDGRVKRDGNVKRDPFDLYLTGHSVGEMASFIEAGITDIETMAWFLSERERITTRPFESGVRLMMAGVNLDMRRFEMPTLEQINKELGDGVQIFLANINNPTEGVLSVLIPNGIDIKRFRVRLSSLFDHLRHPDAEKPVRFIHLESIPNAFHSILLNWEQNTLNDLVLPSLTPDVFRDPDPSVILYSAIYKRRIKTRSEALYVHTHQLVDGVDFWQAMMDMLSVPNLALVVTCDPKEVTPNNLVLRNTGDAVPVVNIKDLATLDDAVERGRNKILPWLRA